MNELSSRFTPVNDSDSSCAHVFATLCVYHIDPDIVTKKLGLIPTSQEKVGALGIMRSGRTVVGTVNSWLLTTENDVLSKDLRTHLSWLMDKIEPSGQALKELQQEPGIQMSVRCYWESAHGDGGPTLWPEQMKRMAELNLEISLTCADYEEE